jgi:hypothetical protein
VGLDIRTPIGLMFAIIGVILAGYGLVAHHDTLGLNMDLIWGAVLTVFGVVMLLLARSAASPRA